MRQVSDKAMDHAAAYANRLIAERLSALGLDPSTGIRAEVGSSGTVLLSRIRTTADGDTAEAENLVTTGDPERPLDAASLRDLDTAVNRHARRVARQCALDAAGVEGRGPAWSHTMHAVALAWFRHAGLDPAMALAYAEDRDTSLFLIRYMAQQKGLSVGEARIEDGRLDFDDVIDDGLQYVGRGRPSLLIHRDVPDTVVAAMPGRIVSEVVDHPAVRRAGPVRIEDAIAQPGLLTIVMADRQEFIRRPPKGFDRAWSRMTFAPRPIG